MDYYFHLLILISLYTMLAQSLNLPAGMGGLLSLSQAGFYGIGAYSAAILSVNFGLSFWINLPLSMLISFVIAAFASTIALRTTDDYFIICTLGIQAIFFAVMNNWKQLTNGPSGIREIPPILLGGKLISDKSSFLILSSVLMTIIWYLLYNAFNSGYGKTLKSISRDEIYTQSIGKNVFAAKVTSFCVGASLAAVPGVLYAHYVSFIDPTSFTIAESIFILSIVIIGGAGDLAGTFIASVILILFPELLRFIGISDKSGANVRQIFYGLLLILVVIKSPKGLASITELKSNKKV